MSSRWMMAATAACASLLLAGCVPGLSDDADAYFGYNEGNVPMLERQTVEAYLKETLPRYAGIVEDVALEAGGTVGTAEKSRSSACGEQGDNLYRISFGRLFIPLIDFEDLRRVVWEGAQRNGFDYSSDPEPVDKLKKRRVQVTDSDGSSIEFLHFDNDVISVSISSGCRPAEKPNYRNGYFHVPAVQELLPDVTLVEAFGEDGSENATVFRQAKPGGGQSGS
ncbi:DUF4853 domain-containing protein [Actinomyces sp.]